MQSLQLSGMPGPILTVAILLVSSSLPPFSVWCDSLFRPTSTQLHRKSSWPSSKNDQLFRRRYGTLSFSVTQYYRQLFCTDIVFTSGGTEVRLWWVSGGYIVCRLSLYRATTWYWTQSSATGETHPDKMEWLPRGGLMSLPVIWNMTL